MPSSSTRGRFADPSPTPDADSLPPDRLDCIHYITAPVQSSARRFPIPDGSSFPTAQRRPAGGFRHSTASPDRGKRLRETGFCPAPDDNILPPG